MTKSKGIFFFVLTGVAFFGACADSKKSGDGSTSTGNAAVDEIITAYCETIRTCCLAAGFSTAPLGSCEAVLATTEGLEAVLGGRAVFREPERAQCVQEIRGMAATCIEPDYLACRRMIDGTVGEGGTCEESEACQRGEVGVACLRIDVSDDEAPGPGTCRSLTPGQLGSACFRTIDEDYFAIGHSTNAATPVLGTCDRRDGLYCDLDNTGTCQALVGAGQPCGFDACPDGYYCEETCLPQLPAGSSCQFSDQCAAGLACVNDVCVVDKITNGDLCEGDIE